MTTGERVAAAALATVGARFRPQGRDPALGLDCVGVVAVAVAAVRPDVRLPRDYALRCAVLPAGAIPAGAVPCAGEAAGDVLLLRVAATQLHLAIRTADGIVHADAGAGRVVARPGVPPWPVVAAWRLGEREG
ncbi:peptidoglycan endopeptidase [Sphingomonas ginsenosidimutans]|jgi:hypothetical protein|uniref:peptidoglycan endopeptidase n=3 Tax=Sphingomonas TaxID=13687 RepID=UPI001E06BA7B|nr:peptidoglycan endopeptidase [Sphingomonas ginsenosidimutans]MBY0301679.1 peptidoglycan endopeptidase [Sphingomonas ginsenosidimutans]